MKESEIRSRDLYNQWIEITRRDLEEFFTDKSRFIKIDCPACGSNDQENVIQRYGFNYSECKNCETLFVNPRPPLDTLTRFYTDSKSTDFYIHKFFPPYAEARREKIFKSRAEYVSRYFSSKNIKTIGDVGAGHGVFLEEIKNFFPDSKLVSIEPAKEMAQICRNKGFEVIESSIEEVKDNYNHFDLLTSFELFEHLYDPELFARKSFELLKSSGYLLFTTLNGLGFDIQILWENAKCIFPPLHLNFFNPVSMKILFKKVGFREVFVTTPGKLDWDIVEGMFSQENIDPGRFWRIVSKYGNLRAKKELQYWIQRNNFSSHMRVIAKK